MTSDLRIDDPTTAALLRAVAGEFRIVREIGRGGMGVVYHAVDERLERAVAIKTLPPHLASDPAVRSRFLREARTAGALSHPNIVPVYQAAERDGVVYFVMALVDGESLAERIQARGSLSVEVLLPIVRQLAVALTYAHEQGVVHRDIKAENVLMDKHERAMVTDFGIARVAEAQPMTATGTVLGTVHYMSPEQVSGDALDGRSDLYALGVLIFYALSGRFPYERSSAPAVLIAHVNAPVPRLSSVLPGVSNAIDELVFRLLAKSPASRVSSANELLSLLSATGRVSELGSVPLASVPLASPQLAPPRMSSRDAEQVWARAAELQANSGEHVSAPSFAAPAELLTRGFDASDVRAAAVDAGIDSRYVNRALVERDAANVVVQRGVSLEQKPNVFLGDASKIEYSAVVERELRADEFEEIADELRTMIGQVVSVSAVGRTLTVNTTAHSGRSGMPRTLQVTVSSRNGRTQIRAFEDLNQVAGGLFGGLGAGAGIGGASLVAALTLKFAHSGAAATMAVLSWIMLALLSARFFFKRASQKRQKELEKLVRDVASRIRALPPV